MSIARRAWIRPSRHSPGVSKRADILDLLALLRSRNRVSIIRQLVARLYRCYDNPCSAGRLRRHSRSLPQGRTQRGNLQSLPEGSCHAYPTFLDTPILEATKFVCRDLLEFFQDPIEVRFRQVGCIAIRSGVNLDTERTHRYRSAWSPEAAPLELVSRQGLCLAVSNLVGTLLGGDGFLEVG